MTHGEYDGGSKRVLKAAGVALIGTHSMRNRATTDIASSGVPAKLGMKLTGHKIVAMFGNVRAVRDGAICMR